MVQRAVQHFRVFVPVAIVLGLLTTIWTPMPSAFAAAPTVTGFSPTSGGTGTRIVITGTNFTGSGNCVVNRVQFGGTDAASYVVNSSTQITATVGTGKTGLVNVRTNGTGCGNKNSVATFTYSAVTYSVAYNANGATSGSVPVDGTTPYASGGTVTVLGNTGSLVKTGNTFANWNTAANGSGTSYSAGNTFAIGSNTILYAQWRATVTYSGNGATGGTIPVDASSPYLSGGTVTVLGNTGSLVKTGNTFANWNTAADGSGTSYSAGNTFAIGADTVLYAQWRAIVTYNSNGATSGTVPVDASSPYLNGRTVTVLGNTGSLVRTGYIFTTWNTAANGSGTSYSAGNTFAIAADTVLYAQWTITYAVSYNANGATSGSVPIDGSSPYASGALVTVSGNTGSLVKTGSTFANWNTASNGSGTSYVPSASFAIGANTILYAQWRATVTYNANGATAGSVPVDGSSPYLNGGTVTVLGNTGSLVKSGYTFAHWNTAPDGSGTSYSLGNTFGIAADTVLYAQWSVITYTVSYNANGATSGSVPVDGSSPYASGSAVTILGNSGALVKTGFVFANWNTAANGSGTSYAPSTSFAIGANTILYAQWTVTYTVTYNGNAKTGGNSPTEGSTPYASGATVSVLGNTGGLVKTGNTFDNWNTAANGSGTSYVGGDTFVIGADTILYAQWRAAVTYVGNGSTGGSVPLDGSSPYLNGASVTVLGNSGILVKTGYIFDNWNTAADGSGSPYASGNTFAIGADTVLYAQWTITNSVTYNGNGSTSGTVPIDGSSPYVNGATVIVSGNSGSLVRIGNTFDNWNTAANGSGTSYSAGNTFGVAANTILYAQWRPLLPIVAMDQLVEAFQSMDPVLISMALASLSWGIQVHLSKWMPTVIGSTLLLIGTRPLMVQVFPTHHRTYLSLQPTPSSMPNGWRSPTRLLMVPMVQLVEPLPLMDPVHILMVPRSRFWATPEP